MANHVKILNAYNDTLNGTAAVYAPATPRSGLVTSIMMSSSASTPPMVTLNVIGQGGAAAALTIAKRTLGAAPTIISDLISVGVGEKIQVVTTASVNVQFVVMGIERD